MSDQLWAVILGVLSSVIASLVWLLGLRRVRPRIEISPWIVEDGGEAETSPCFRIKIINRSRRAAVDLAFELAVMRPERTSGGIVKMRRIVRTAGPPPLIIPGRGRGDDSNTYRIRIDADLRRILSDDKHRYIRLRVFARDEISGVGRVCEREYYEPSSDLVIGRYAKGQSFETVTS